MYRSSNTFDYGVQEFRSERPTSGRYRTAVVVRRYGEAMFPVDVVTTFDDGQQVKERGTAGPPRDVRLRAAGAGRRGAGGSGPRAAARRDYTNNSRTLTPRGGEASLKWSLKWMVWLQDLMLTYGFFV